MIFIKVSGKKCTFGTIAFNTVYYTANEEFKGFY